MAISMNTVFVLEKKDQVSFYLSALKGFFKEKNYSISRVTYSNYEKIGFASSSDIVIVEYLAKTNEFAKVQKLIKGFQNPPVIVFAYNSKSISSEELTRLSELCEQEKIVTGIIDLSIDKKLQYPQLRKLTENESQYDLMDKNRIKNINDDLNILLKKVENEFQRVRKIYKNFIPRRFKKIGGLSIYSKYSSGIGSGGEFFDYVQVGHNIIFMMSSTNSYLMSSSVIKYFKILKEMDEIDDKVIRDCFVGLGKESQIICQTVDDSKELPFQLFVANVDLAKLKVTGYNFGHTQIISQKDYLVQGNNNPVLQEFLDDSSFAVKLVRGQKYLIISPGLRGNTQERLKGSHLQQALKDMLHLKPLDVLDEIFYNIKKEHSQQQIKFDSSVILLGVDENAIYQV